jgi:aerobic-type carbon monoxide dehydrogenase small subunit (CoxS/CutS family)
LTPKTISLTLNGRRILRKDIPDSERLLDTLRWRLGFKGTKEGCRTGDCGACTVLVDGANTLSCLTLTHEVAGRKILTIEGVGSDPIGKKVQAAFEAESALQCGYCTPGFVIAVTGLLKANATHANSVEFIEDLQGNHSRCTGYGSIDRAIER